ncbi:MAG TPA: cell envelope integrity protein TolA [Usitatibacter sp.]|nr:cell envelope integrity protein TolA [Usitatibacter sp.]
MSAGKTPPASLEKRPQPGRVRSVILALVVHAIFFALIVFGVTWQNRPEAPFVAEIWDKLPPAQKSAPPPTPEPAPPKPEPVKPPPEPPKTAPEPVKPAPKPPEEKPEPPKPDPEIARKLEREKREKVKQEEAKREKERKDKADREKAKQEEAKKKREEEVRQKEEQEAFRAAQQAREQAAAQRQAEYLQWVGKIRDKIRGKANVPDTVIGRPEVQVHIRILPGGEVFDVAITKPSGNPTYDAAIERAVRSSSPLPVPAANSELFSQFRDLTLNIKHDR